jgi:cystathionine gamma-synthase
VLCGVIAGKRSLIDRIQQTQVLLGGILDPHAAWLLLRGIKTLGLRVQRASDTAFDLARFLDARDEVVAVHELVSAVERSAVENAGESV